MNPSQILDLLPYSKPFLFVDELQKVSAESVEGRYCFRVDSHFYKGHFKDNPVTPGVILTECCAQIGLVSLGIYLLKDEVEHGLNCPQIAMTSSQMEFLLPVFPGETVKVVSEKEYFRFNKLKCKVKMFNAQGELVCAGVLSGMFKNNADGK